jgi:hypothetical protein
VQKIDLAHSASPGLAGEAHGRTMPNGIAPSRRKYAPAASEEAGLPAPKNHVSPCPLETEMGRLIVPQSPPDSYNLMRGSLPIAVVALIMAGAISSAFLVGRTLENYKQEQSAISGRIDKVETKIDKITTWIMKSGKR